MATSQRLVHKRAEFTGTGSKIATNHQVMVGAEWPLEEQPEMSTGALARVPHIQRHSFFIDPSVLYH
jgi:hypothetical protein